MCTLSFIPRSSGYLIGMNRDERLAREQSLPPERISLNGVDAIYPREASGGTWIGSNSLGVTFALLNRNPGATRIPKQRSRGFVIPPLLDYGSPVKAARRMAAANLEGMLPFRLIGCFPDARAILEWNWDGNDLSAMQLPWRKRHWFSSGVSDVLASSIRGRTFYAAWRRRNAGSSDWLRRIHASHAPTPGALSVCVHRPDAASVSYTEIDCEMPALTMRHHAGYPCDGVGRFQSELVLDLKTRSRIAVAS